MVFFSPSDYVHTPLVEPGEYEVEAKYGHAQLRPGDDLQASNSLGVGASVGERWFTEVYAKWEQTLADGQHFDAFEWENRIQLTERGAHDYELGLLLELERPRDRAEGYEFRVGGLWQTALGHWQLNANLLLTRNWRAEQTAAVPPQFGYELQLKYRLNERFEPGLQAFGATGDATNCLPAKQQAHKLGPAFFGAVPVGVHQRLRYNAAWLRGLTEGAPRNTLRVQLEYEF